MSPIEERIAGRHRPAAAYTLIILNVAVFVALSSAPESVFDAVFGQYTLVPRRLFDPVWASAKAPGANADLTLITSTFIHGGWVHLGLNMIVLYIFGRLVERHTGPVAFAAVYLVSGIAASLAHAICNASSTVPALGASGAIAGIVGTYVVAFPKTKIAAFALVWFAVQAAQVFVDSFAPAGSGGVSWPAHAGGFAAGVLFSVPLLRGFDFKRRHARSNAVQSGPAAGFSRSPPFEPEL